MGEREDDTLSADDAARVWRLSSQRQVEASGREATPALTRTPADLPSGSYSLALVRSAAREAGIGDGFVESALVDLRAWQVLSHVGRGHRFAWRLLGDPPDMIVARRVINATAEGVMAAMQAVLPGAPFRLSLRDRKGDPERQGVLLFDLPGVTTPFERGFAFETSEAGLRQVVVSLRPIDGPGNSCEITVHSAMTAHNLGSALTLVAATIAGAIGFGVFAGLGLAVAGALGSPAWLPAIAAAAGGIAGATLGLKGIRRVYRFAVRRAREALEGMLGAVASRAEGIW